MKHKRLILFFVVFTLFTVSFTAVNAKKEVEGDTFTDEVYLYFDDVLIEEGNGVISPLGTISSANLKISRTYTQLYSNNKLSGINVTITWEWLKYTLNYREDTVVISWDSSQVDWRFSSSSVVRRIYTKNQQQSSWQLRKTDYSIRDTHQNGFAYDQTLILDKDSSSNIKTLNKGTISFRVNPLTETVGKYPAFYLYVNYYHKVLDVLGFESGVSVPTISPQGSPTVSIGLSYGTRYDSQGVSIACPYNIYLN